MLLTLAMFIQLNDSSVLDLHPVCCTCVSSHVRTLILLHQVFVFVNIPSCSIRGGYPFEIYFHIWFPIWYQWFFQRLLSTSSNTSLLHLSLFLKVSSSFHSQTESANSHTPCHYNRQIKYSFPRKRSFGTRSICLKT